MQTVNFKIEKEIKWDSHKMESKELWFIFAGWECVHVEYTEEAALAAYEKVKANYRPSEKKIVKEEKIEIGE